MGPAKALAPERYRLERHLGQGGLCSVYKAWDNELERFVALKLLHPLLADQGSALQRLKREVLLASRVSHKHVVQVYDFGSLYGNHFVTMQLVEGGTLRALLNQQGRLERELALRLAREMAEGMEAIHEAGVIHRDLKPENVLLDPNLRVYISDFGLAAVAEGGSQKAAIDQDRCGTPRYMSPEQTEGQALDARSDIYSFGLILHEMWTGQQFEHQNRTAIAEDGVRELTERCLALRKEDRFESFGKARESLAQLQRARRPAGVSVTALAAGLLAVVAGVALWMKQPEPVPPIQSLEKALEMRERARTDAEHQVVAEEIERLIASNRRHAGAWAALAGVEMLLAGSTGSPQWREKARKSVEQAMAIDPMQPQVRLALAKLLTAEGQATQAVELLDQLRREGAGSGDIERVYALSLMHAGRVDEARMTIERAVAAEPKSWRHREVLASIHFREGRLDDAERQFRAVIALDSRNGNACNNLGAIQIRRGQYAKSIEWFERALREQPKAATYANVGTAYFYTGKFHLASTMFERAVSMQPNSEVYSGFLAEAARWSGDHGRATEALAQAIRQAEIALTRHPGVREVEVRLAYYHAKAGDRRKAEQLLDRVLGAEPGHRSALYARGLMHLMANRGAAALADLRRALEQGYSWHQAFGDPNWRVMEADPRWRAILHEFRGR